MSKENVEIVRRIFEAVSRRDSASVLALYDPEIELHVARDTFAEGIAGGQHVYRGHDGLRNFDQELREAFEEVETSCKELIDAGDRVVSVSQYGGRGRVSGIKVEGPLQYGVWTIRESRVTRVDWFGTREEALEAAGLGG